LKKLNAGFHSWLTDPSEPRDVLVPVDAAATFRLQLDSLPKIATQTIPTNTSEQNAYHTVKSGESLWSIAKAENTTVATLIKLNNLNSKSALKPGQKLALAEQSLAQTVTSEVKTQKASSYTIKAGDTLGQIAARYDISVKQIMEWNKIQDETSIRPNQELIVMAEPKN